MATIAVLLIWPAIGLSVIASAIAIAWRRPPILPVAALVGVPFFIYLGLNPRYGWVVLAAPAGQAIAAVALARGARGVAAALCAPAALIALDLLVAMRQRSPIVVDQGSRRCRTDRRP